MALRTNRLATVATHHHPVLNLVLVFLHHAEECVKANCVVFQFTVFASIRREAMPQHVFLFTRKLIVWREYGEVGVFRLSAKRHLPFLHLLSVPALHATIVDRER